MKPKSVKRCRILATGLLTRITENIDELFEEEILEAIETLELGRKPTRRFLIRTLGKLGFERKPFHENGYPEFIWIRKLSRNASQLTNTMATTIDNVPSRADNESIQ